MGAGVDVGVDADADGRLAAQLHGNLVEHVQFVDAFDVEAADAGLQRLAHFAAFLADAAEDDPGRVGPGCQGALEFTAGDDVEAAAGLGKHLQHGQRGVGLHGEADQGVAAGKALLVGLQRAQHGGLGINEQRRAVLARQIGDGHAVDAKLVVGIVGQGRGAGELQGGHDGGASQEGRGSGPKAERGRGVSGCRRVAAGLLQRLARGWGPVEGQRPAWRPKP